MLRGVWRRLRRLFENNRIFLPVLIVVVIVLVIGFSRVLTTVRFFPSFDPLPTPMAVARTPEPLTGPAPNVVVIVVNDLRPDDVRVMPNVQKLLAGHGVTFTNAFAVTPLGSPSRAALLSGQASFKSGVWDNGAHGGIYRFRQRSTIATWMKQAGFDTGFVGRYLNGYELIDHNGFVPPGWNIWNGYLSPSGAYYRYSMDDNGKITAFRASSSSYVTDVLTDRATTFISGAEKPFCLYVSMVGIGPPAPPAAADARAFTNEPNLRPPSYNVQASGTSPAAEVQPLPKQWADYVDSYRRRSLAALQSVDRGVARIVDAVDKLGQLDDTVFMFTSDKGLLLGEHRIFGSIWPYEPAIRIPLIVRMPSITGPETNDQLVANTDIVPTIAELTGVTPQLSQDGMSFAPLLKNEPVEWRQELLLSYLGKRSRPDYPPRYRALRTERYLFVVYDDRSRELFDLENDPDELHNIAGTPAASEIEGPLLARLNRSMPTLPEKALPLPTFPPSPAPNSTPDVSGD